MNSKFKKKDSPDTDRGESSVIASVKKIQKHLVFLEKKIDTLLEQSKGRSFNKSSHFSKPRKPYSNAQRSDRNNQERSFHKSSRGDNPGNSRNKKRRFGPGRD